MACSRSRSASRLKSRYDSSASSFGSESSALSFVLAQNTGGEREASGRRLGEPTINGLCALADLCGSPLEAGQYWLSDTDSVVCTHFSKTSPLTDLGWRSANFESSSLMFLPSIDPFENVREDAE